MPITFLTGKLGAGKSLSAVARMREYAGQGRRIAGNLDLYLDKFATHPHSKVSYTRIPDRPTAADLMALGSGNDTYDENNNGLLVLDELATWLNARNWQDPNRKALLDWFVHARKYGWDVIFLVQDISMVDGQLREALAEYHAVARRLDRVRVPLLGSIWKLFTGKPLMMPKMHIVTVRYGTDQNAIVADRWTCRGNLFWPMYDTKQVISDSYPHGPHCQLSRWHLEGRYQVVPPSWRQRLGRWVWLGFTLALYSVGAVMEFLIRPRSVARF